MEAFLVRAYDLCNIGRTDEEQKWLSKFVDHVQKYLFKDSSTHTCMALSLTILERLTTLTPKKCKLVHNVDVNCDDGNDDDDDDQQTTKYTPYHELFPISSLAKKREISSGQLVIQNEFTNSTGDNFGYKPLVPVVPSFLLGYLRWCPSSLKSSGLPTCGSLFLEDNSAYLPIEISNPAKMWLDQLVIVPSWTFVPAPDNFHQSSHNLASLSANGYIEATACCVPTFLKISYPSLGSLPLPVSLSLTEYKERQRTEKRMVLSLHGKVTAVSPVHSMFNSKPFFFIELTCTDSSISTPVVIQGAHFMHWVHFVDIETEYILTELRETTMNKGTRNERKILASTKMSKVLEFCRPRETIVQAAGKRKTDENINDRTADNVPSKRLKSNDGKPCVSMVHTADHANMSKTAQPKTLSYKGVITKCYPQPHVSCYEIDSKVRLYTVHQPCPSIGRGMRVGAEVSLYNVHPVKKGKDLLGLCCCTLSSVRITKYSSLDSEWKPSLFTSNPFTLHGQNMSLQEYVEFTQACEKLLKKFSKTERPSSLIGYSSSRQKRSSNDKKVQLSVIEKLLDARKSSIPLPSQPRNIYQEFFDHPHTCYPTRPESINLPTISTIEELKQMVLEKSKGLAWQSGAKDGPSRSNEWLYQMVECGNITNGLILLGHLKSSSTTGFLKLHDQTGKIPVHVTVKQDSYADETTAIESLLDSRDCIVQINKFDVVIEKFQNSVLESLAGEKRTRIYVQTSTNNLKQMTPKKEVKSKTTNEAAAVISTLKNPQRLQCCSDQGNEKKLSGSTSKECITGLPSNDRTKDFDLHTSRDQSITCEESDSTHLFTCQVLFLVRHRENLQLKKKRKVLYACAVDVKVVGLISTNETQGFDDDVCDSVSRMTRKNKSVVLRLQSESTTLHPYLYEGCFYILTELASSKVNSLVMRSLNNTSRSILNVTSSMSVTLVRVPTDGVTEGCHAMEVADSKEQKQENAVAMAMNSARKRFLCNDEDKLQSVEGILNSNISKSSDNVSEIDVKQVNFTGRIIHREMRLSDTCGQLLPGNNVFVPHFGALEESTVHLMELGYGYLGNNTLFICVQDLHSPNTLDVYVDLSTAPYKDGLLPGAVISCRRFLRKVSRNGNVYCSFDACSSLTVQVAASKDPRDTSSNTVSKVDSNNQQMSAVPCRLLADLVRCEASGNRIHTISRIRCRVTSVQKLLTRWHCSKCSHVIVREECPQGCRSNDGFRFCAEASCLVEDGTAEALVYLSNESISFLLKLSNDELSKLKSYALSLGELVYQRHSYGRDILNKGDNAHLLSKQSEANRILADRCCAQQVKRSVILYCKPMGSVNKKADITEQEYETRPITINQTEHSTFVLPKLLLKAVDMTDVDYQEEAKRLLCSLDIEGEADT